VREREVRERVSALLTLLRPPSPAGDVSGPPHRSGDLQDQTCIERFLAQSPTTDAKGAVATSLLETLTDISVSAQRLFFSPRQAGPGTMVDVAIFEHIEATVTKLACKRKAKAKQIKCWGDALANRRRELEALDVVWTISPDAGGCLLSPSSALQSQPARRSTRNELAGIQMRRKNALARWTLAPPPLDAYRSVLQEVPGVSSSTLPPPSRVRVSK